MPKVLRCLVFLLLLGVAIQVHASPDSQTAWRLLDYVAVDYPAAVQDGQVVNDGEYAEMVEFAESIRVRLAALPATAARSQLIQQAESLQAAVAQKAATATVAGLARNLAGDLLAAYPQPLAPSQAPDLTRTAVLYQQQCSSCHGATGGGDGIAGAALNPPPIDFTDQKRARERSVFALYQVIEQGLEGTGMASYAALPQQDRWALSFYIGQFAYPAELAVAGEHLWNRDRALRAQFPNLGALTQVTPATLATRMGERDAQALTAFLRRQPQAVKAELSSSLTLARARLADSLQAYAAGDQRAARDLALSAYLDGFEPVEPLLAARDPQLMARIEGAMATLRSRIGEGATIEVVKGQVEAVDALFGEAETALSPERASNVSAFLGAFSILLREGLEALLVLIAIVAFLRKAERPEVLPYVHAGWIGALLAGVLTWGAATWLISISGASRELTEGFAALFAASVLLFVGIWMHGKSQAGAWQRYIKEKLSHALSKRSVWFLFLLSFVVVYREVFETVLFFAALWSQGSKGAVVAGGGVGMLVLAGLAWAMLRYSRKLPIAQFFSLSSLLISVLAVVLAGKGIAALQEAGWLSVSLIQFPRITLLGVYPTLQSIAAQLLALSIVLAGFWYNGRTVKVGQG